ncbi:MAG: hypothetical protein GYA53_07955 [Acidobacteria bacterium]|nr:hypothetical protein [Acidobacteriota bacterium]
MKKEDEKLKNLFFSTEQTETNKPRVDCPAPEELARFFDPEVSLDLKENIVDHLIRCPACQQEFELLRLAENLVTEIDAQLLKPKKSCWQKLRSLFPSAPFLKQAGITLAAIMVIFSLFYFLNLNGRKSQQVERNSREANDLMMSEEISQTPLVEISLKWQPVQEALFYQVEVFNHNMYLVWQSSPVTDTLIRLPKEISDNLKTNSHFFWQILIYCPGERIIESPVRKVKLGHQ